MHSGTHGFRKRFGHIADTAAYHPRGCLGIGIREGFHTAPNLREEVTSFQLQIVVVEKGHGDLLVDS